MKIKKDKNYKWVYYYYKDSKTNYWIYHGLDNDPYYYFGIGYHYHEQKKGFWLRKIKIL